MFPVAQFLSCLLVSAANASPGEINWTGRARHLAVVNPAVRPADDPQTLSLRGTWKFVKCPTGGYRQSQMPKGRTWYWDDDPSIVHDVQVPGCWEASGAIPGTGMSRPWTCSDRSPLEIRGLHSGAGWYKRTVKIPAQWKGRRIWFKPGWVNCVGSFWVNGEAVSMEYENFCGTYKYDVTDLVAPGGEALVVVEAINDFPSFRGCFNFVNRWGGILRAPEFEATPMDAWIDEAWGRVDYDERMAELHVTVGRASPGQGDAGSGTSGRIRVTVEGSSVERQVPRSGDVAVRIPLSVFRPWSPQEPNLYTAKVEFVSAAGETLQTRQERFGARKFERRGGELYLNGRPFFVRGAGWHDINPIEGAAPCDREYWLKAGRRVKEAGFNYIRLHTQARSPEFFEACDELGLMVQPELPYYTDVPGDRQRFDPLADAKQLYLAYRRHPSFVTYCGGNEGSFGPVLGKMLYDEIKARDPDRLVMGQDCYPGVAYNRPGTSDFAAAPTTVWPRGSFRDERPFIAHEYMNLSVKLDYRLEERFTGVWVSPVTRKSREAFLAVSGLSMALGDRLQEAQHALQAVWRKYGIESARLDPECDGYSFWSLQDVCVLNKGTPAAQALFDPFWGDKRGGESASGVAVYNSPSCLLLRDGDDPERWERDFRNLRGWHNLFADSMATNRVRRSGEMLRARFYFAHYGESQIADATLSWRLAADGRVLASGAKDIGTQALGAVRPVGSFDIAVPGLPAATKAKLTATIESGTGEKFSNSWDYWLFPGRKRFFADGVACADELRASLEGRYANLVRESAWRTASTVIAMRGSALETAALAAGKNVISLSGQSGKTNIMLGWWWMGSQVGSVVNDHPWLKRFPHDGVFSQLFFRIAKEGLKLPVAGVAEKDIVMVGEGADACYLYLAECESGAGGRVCHIAGLDVLSDTPEGTAILDGAIGRMPPQKARPATASAAPAGMPDTVKLADEKFRAHVQGVCTDGTNIYWSMTYDLVKTDLSGRELARYGAKFHMGDLCWHRGRIYVGVNRMAEKGVRRGDEVWVFEPERLERVKVHPTPQTIWCNNGIEWYGGRFWIVSCAPVYSKYNYVYEYTEDFKFVQCRPIESGWTMLGVQTICRHGDKMLFGCYGNQRDPAMPHKSCMFAVDVKDLARESRNAEYPYVVPLAAKVEAMAAEGMLVLNGGIWIAHGINHGQKGNQGRTYGAYIRRSADVERKLDSALQP